MGAMIPCKQTQYVDGGRPERGEGDFWGSGRKKMVSILKPTENKGSLLWENWIFGAPGGIAKKWLVYLKGLEMD